MFSTNRFAGLLWSLPAALLLTADMQPAFAQSVDCNAGQSIQSRINAGDTFIDFTGVCNEFVFIQNDQTVIQGFTGDPADAVISFGLLALGVQGISLDSFTADGNVSIQSGSNASLFNVVLAGGASLGNTASIGIFDSTVTGSGSFSVFRNASLFMGGSTIDDLRGGVNVTDGAEAQFSNTDITNTDNGVFVGRNGSLRFRDGLMGPALVDDGNLSCNPLCASDSASIRLDNVDIEGANNDPIVGGAISLTRNSTLTLRGTNVVTNDGSQPAIGVFNDSSVRQDRSGGSGSQINGNVQVVNMSNVDIRAAVITGDVEVDLHSVFRLGSTSFAGDPENTVLTGNGTIGRDSAFVVEDPLVTVNGEITCLDRESSFSGGFTGVVKFNNCTDFDGRKLADDDDD